MSRDPSYQSSSQHQRLRPEVEVATLKMWRRAYKEYRASLNRWKHLNEYREALIESFARLVTPWPSTEWIESLAEDVYGIWYEHVLCHYVD